MSIGAVSPALLAQVSGGGTLARLRNAALPVGTIAGLIAVWEVVAVVGKLPTYVLPTPQAVVEAAASNAGTLAAQAVVTLGETLVGFAFAVVVAIPLAIVIVQWPLLKQSIYPVLILLQSVPKVALAPILLIWIGFGEWPKILIAMLTCFFPIFLDSAAGFGATPDDHLDLFRSIQANSREVFWKLRTPYAMPQIFVGLKTGITFAVVGAVVAEFVQSSEGLGYLILIYASQLKTALAFAAMILLALISIVLFYLLEAVEHRVVPWAESHTGTE